MGLVILFLDETVVQPLTIYFSTITSECNFYVMYAVQELSTKTYVLSTSYRSSTYRYIGRTYFTTRYTTHIRYDGNNVHSVPPERVKKQEQRLRGSIKLS